MYRKIVNPETNKNVSIYSKLGKNILSKYLNILVGGMDPLDRTQDQTTDAFRADFGLGMPPDGAHRGQDRAPNQGAVGPSDARAAAYVEEPPMTEEQWQALFGNGEDPMADENMDELHAQLFVPERLEYQAEVGAIPEID